MAFNVSTITDYVKGNETQLIGKAVIGANTLQYINLQTGVKGKAYLNLLTADPYLQSGTCGWNTSGSTSVTRREIDTNPVKVNETFCDKDLINTFMQHEVKVAAGQKTLPFEEEFIGQQIKGINKKLEEMIWRGNTVSGTGHLGLVDGFIKVISGSTGVLDATVSGSTLLGNTLDAVDAIVAKLPDEIMDREDLVVFVGTDVYRKAIKGWQDQNLYHYVPAELNGKMETIIPGTTIKLVGTHGLAGQSKAYASYGENFYYGTDMMSDQEKFMFWYSEDNSEFRFKVEFNAGVQVAFPDLVVKYIG